MRRLDWGLALLAAALTALFVLRPWGARPEDLHLEVVSVRALPHEPQAVAVEVRWRWRKPPRSAPPGTWDVVVISMDPERWALAEPTQGTGPDVMLLNVSGQPAAYRAIRAIHGQDGEQMFILRAEGIGYHYKASAIPLRIHYLHRAPEDWSPPGSSWVRTVEGRYALGSSTH